jgi:hypothetical protein
MANESTPSQFFFSSSGSMLISKASESLPAIFYLKLENNMHISTEYMLLHLGVLFMT